MENKNHIPAFFWQIPETATITMQKKELRETILATDGTIIAKGDIWEIHYKSIGLGLYKVWITNKFIPK
jgi:hypothetical protein